MIRMARMQLGCIIVMCGRIFAGCVSSSYGTWHWQMMVTAVLHAVGLFLAY